MATNSQVTRVLNSLAQFPGCPSCGVRMRFGDLECPRCGDDLYDELRAWAEALIDDITSQEQ